MRHFPDVFVVRIAIKALIHFASRRTAAAVGMHSCRKGFHPGWSPRRFGSPRINVRGLRKPLALPINVSKKVIKAPFVRIRGDPFLQQSNSFFLIDGRKQNAAKFVYSE